MRKIFLWGVLLVLLVSLAGCFGRDSEWKTYSNKDIEFSYPGSWKIRDVKDFGIQFSPEVAIYDVKGDFRASISLLVEQSPFLAPSAMEQANREFTMYQLLGGSLGIKDLRKISLVPMKIGNTDVVLATIETTIAQNNLVFRGQLLIVPFGSKTYTLSLGSVKEDWETYESTFKHVVSSVKLMGVGISNPKEAPNQEYVSLVNVGNSYFDQGKYEQAIESYEKALRIIPDDPNVLVDLGTSYFYQRNSNPDKAITMYDRALQISPNFRNALYNKGVILREGKRDYVGAKAVWKQFLKYYPSGEQAENVRRWIEGR